MFIYMSEYDNMLLLEKSREAGSNNPQLSASGENMAADNENFDFRLEPIRFSPACPRISNRNGGFGGFHSTKRLRRHLPTDREMLPHTSRVSYVISYL